MGAIDRARRADTWPQGDHITWTFPASDKTVDEGITLEWFDGEMYPPEDVQKMSELNEYPAESAMVIGTEKRAALAARRHSEAAPDGKI